MQPRHDGQFPHVLKPPRSRGRKLYKPCVDERTLPNLLPVHDISQQFLLTLGSPKIMIYSPNRIVTVNSSLLSAKFMI